MEQEGYDHASGLRPAAGFIIKKRLILGTIIALSIALGTHFVTIPIVAVETTSVRQSALPVAEAHEPERTSTLEQTNSIARTEQTVRAYWADIPLMAEVAWCESRFVHIDPATGGVKRGHLNASDLGVMQINEYYHGATARRMGLDLHELKDNLAYARFLYDQQGTRPWNASKNCWGPHAHLALR